MSISGDMVSGASGATKMKAKDVRGVLAAGLEAARDPNFANAYARQYLEEWGHPSRETMKVGGSDTKAHNDKMLDYWDVIQFLVDHL